LDLSFGMTLFNLHVEVDAVLDGLLLASPLEHDSGTASGVINDSAPLGVGRGAQSHCFS
jgi:hypothetical protein